MASTWSNLKFELIGTGDQSGTWGATTNDNLGIAIEQAIGGKADVTMSSTTITLTLTDTTALQNARALYLNLTGTPGGAATLEVPAVQKAYIVYNNTTGGFAVTVKVSGQTGVSVPNGKTMVLYDNGTDVVDAITHLSSLTLGSALPIGSGGTGAALTDPNADRILFWDDSASSVAFLEAGSGLSISGTTLSATASGDVTAAGNNAFTGANTFYNATGQAFAPATTNDGIILQGRAGGSSSYRVTFATATLSANRTLTFPDASTTMVGTDVTQTLTNKTIVDPIVTLGAGQGTAGQVPVSQGAGLPPVWVDAAGVDVQEFAASGTWTKPSGASFVMVELWGAGGGGGSGCKNSSTRTGGAGGGGGVYVAKLFDAADLPGAATVTIGAGGAGGAGITGTGFIRGNAGGIGGSTSFEGLVAFGGGGGAGGAEAARTGGAGAGLFAAGSSGGSSTVSGAAPTNAGGLDTYGGASATTATANQAIYGGASGAPAITGSANVSTQSGGGSIFGGAGGGAGGNSASPSNTTNGGSPTQAIGGGGAGGVSDAANPTNGADGAPFCGGGGGGATTNAVKAGNGGKGGIASGGGGGGANTDAANRDSGDGGNGGDGYARITCW